MSKTSFAIIAGALSMTLGVLTPFGVTAQETVFITPSGNVGIGTASPSVPLHVSRSTGAILEGIRMTNDNEARITIENTGQSTKYIMGVKNTNPALFFISRDGGGGTIVEMNKRLDAGTDFVIGSGGNVTLHAVDWVALGSGFRVSVGGQLKVVVP